MGNDVDFEVPRSHWEAIFSAMLPAKKDDHAAKWVQPGHLDLNLFKTGTPLTSRFIPSIMAMKGGLLSRADV